MNIALAFSGGGYRAAAFNLGVISFLSRIRFEDSSLLENVTILSTVSGGTITGAKYAIGIKQGQQFDEIYESLYSFMSEKDLVSLALDRLISKNGWAQNRTKSLINAIADVYDSHLFDGVKFGCLFDDNPSIHLKHMSFNATEFANALQFRFQWSEKILKPEKDEPERGIIGNHYYRVPNEIAEHIRMADILAASSCFPGGFEPINFPTDFVLPNAIEMNELKDNDKYPLGLMDGGIVDNQGIGPIVLAEARIRRNYLNSDIPVIGENSIDLIIVSDVASPYMEDYQASKQNTIGLWRKLSPKFIFFVNSIILIASGSCAYLAATSSQYLWLVLSTIMFTVTAAIFVLAEILKSIPTKLHIPEEFLRPFGKLLRLQLGVYETLLRNRIDSMLKLTNDVFLKHIRRLNYQTIFNNASWRNRRIMNAIYELKEGEKRIQSKIDAGTLSADLMPTPIMQKVANKACSMGTTLWFTKEELESDDNDYNMLDAIVACGQFTICWNLLEYIEKVKRDDSNTTANTEKIIACEQDLLAYWDRFKIDPYCLLIKTAKQ